MSSDLFYAIDDLLLKTTAKARKTHIYSEVMRNLGALAYSFWA